LLRVFALVWVLVEKLGEGRTEGAGGRKEEGGGRRWEVGRRRERREERRGERKELPEKKGGN
jgi:hypothetical protein